MRASGEKMDQHENLLLKQHVLYPSPFVEKNSPQAKACLTAIRWKGSW